MNDKPIKWILDNQDDIIQKLLMSGNWYEEEYLKIMKQYCKPKSTILEVGANIGSHTIYFSRFFDAKEIYVIEPIPRTYTLLLANIAANYCHNVNTDYIGVALGNTDAIGYPAMIFGKDNLGGTLISPAPFDNCPEENKNLLFDPVQVIPGDSLFENTQIDFMKIDVETMEVIVLEGLTNTIRKSKPNIFIEVFDQNVEKFLNWVNSENYHVVYHAQLPGQSNYIVVPNE